MIRAGALHRANGGYLILDAHKLLTRPFAWEGLKRALIAEQIRIESLGRARPDHHRDRSSPSPIPLDVKVVLLGDRDALLPARPDRPGILRAVQGRGRLRRAHDRDSGERAAVRPAASPTLAREEKLLPLDRGAVAEVLEHAVRLAGDSDKLSTPSEDHSRPGARGRLLGAGRNGHEVIRAEDVAAGRSMRAATAPTASASASRSRSAQETMLIDTDGEQIGQVNGLSVLTLGELAFGQPQPHHRRGCAGHGEVVDIEREVELGGPLHSKGVLILSGFLGARFAPDAPAVAVREPGVRAVLRRRRRRQRLARPSLCACCRRWPRCRSARSSRSPARSTSTGEVQAIGGVNEKIEGFFDLCSRRGLTGRPGRADPGGQRQAPDAARRRGRAPSNAASFTSSRYAPSIAAWNCRTGLEAGARTLDGGFSEGSVNQRVREKLLEFAEMRRAFSAGGAESDNDDVKT